MAMCIGLNPSTADANDDDATISHLTNILRYNGFGGFYMLNLFALITPKPEDLRMCPDPLKDNDKYLRDTAADVRTVIFCWAEYRAKKIRTMFADPMCFGLNKNGSPKHPMALWRAGIKNEDVRLKPFT